MLNVGTIKALSLSALISCLAACGGPAEPLEDASEDAIGTGVTLSCKTDKSVLDHFGKIGFDAGISITAKVKPKKLENFTLSYDGLPSRGVKNKTRTVTGEKPPGYVVDDQTYDAYSGVSDAECSYKPYAPKAMTEEWEAFALEIGLKCGAKETVAVVMCNVSPKSKKAGAELVLRYSAAQKTDLLKQKVYAAKEFRGSEIVVDSEDTLMTIYRVLPKSELYPANGICYRGHTRPLQDILFKMLDNIAPLTYVDGDLSGAEGSTVKFWFEAKGGNQEIYDTLRIPFCAN